MKRLVSIAAMVIVAGGVVVIARAYDLLGEPVVQPIQFNHLVHVEDAGLQCIDCHRNAETGVYAGLPGKAICLDCHDIDEEQGAHVEKDKLFAFEDRDDDIPWRRVTHTRPDVFFSHRRHVRSGKIDCLECHTDQRTLVTPPRHSRLVKSMNECLGCHERQSVSTDCLACHR
ncbi:MAG: cytochrome c3 family protein [Phycisphaerae bacterium]